MLLVSETKNGYKHTHVRAGGAGLNELFQRVFSSHQNLLLLKLQLSYVQVVVSCFASDTKFDIVVCQCSFTW